MDDAYCVEEQRNSNKVKHLIRECFLQPTFCPRNGIFFLMLFRLRHQATSAKGSMQSMQLVVNPAELPLIYTEEDSFYKRTRVNIDRVRHGFNVLRFHQCPIDDVNPEI